MNFTGLQSFAVKILTEIGEKFSLEQRPMSFEWWKSCTQRWVDI